MMKYDPHEPAKKRPVPRQNTQIKACFANLLHTLGTIGRSPSAHAHDAHAVGHLALAIVHGLLAAILIAEGWGQAPHAACAGGAAIIYLILSRLRRRG